MATVRLHQMKRLAVQARVSEAKRKRSSADLPMLVDDHVETSKCSNMSAMWTSLCLQRNQLTKSTQNWWIDCCHQLVSVGVVNQTSYSYLELYVRATYRALGPKFVQLGATMGYLSIGNLQGFADLGLLGTVCLQPPHVDIRMLYIWQYHYGLMCCILYHLRLKNS